MNKLENLNNLIAFVASLQGDSAEFIDVIAVNYGEVVLIKNIIVTKSEPLVSEKNTMVSEAIQKVARVAGEKAVLDECDTAFNAKNLAKAPSARQVMAFFELAKCKRARAEKLSGKTVAFSPADVLKYFRDAKTTREKAAKATKQPLAPSPAKILELFKPAASLR